MGLKVIITPKFNTKQIIDTTIKKDWFRFQNEAFLLGNRILSFMQGFINVNRKRRGGTGKLAKAMKLDMLAGAGTGRIFWGIGKITDLQQQVPYWYVINYGKMITGQKYVPYHGKSHPGSFEGSPPFPGLRNAGTAQFNKNDGSGFSMSAKTTIRPMNYIQASRHKLNIELRRVLLTIAKG